MRNVQRCVMKYAIPGDSTNHPSTADWATVRSREYIDDTHYSYPSDIRELCDH